MICQRPVTQDELEMELEYATPTGGNPELATFHLHVRCFAAWEFERKKVSQ